MHIEVVFWTGAGVPRYHLPGDVRRGVHAEMLRDSGIASTAIMGVKMTSSHDASVSPALGNDSVLSVTDVRPARPPIVPPPIVPPPFPAEENMAPPSSTEVPDNESVLHELKKATDAAVSHAAANVSKDELAIILEGFAKVLRADAKYDSVGFADHAAEVGQLKQLLVEAQETIITLLNDRVYDRAKLARLETEVRVMPDLQAQATRAIRLANHSEEVQREIVQVRAEVERLRTAYMRSEESMSLNWFTRLFRSRP
ncbi:MAG TPA: hypothetical protein V6D22_07330 [Candidatus Obscuribacterales bacterium]